MFILFPNFLLAQFTGGDENGENRILLLQSPACSLPPFVHSAIYTGGAQSEGASAELTQSALCAIPLFVPSDIYKGGAASLSGPAFLNVNATCNIPQFVPSDIYKGGIQDTLGSISQILFTCGQTPPPPPNIYAGGNAGMEYSQKIQVSPSCGLPTFVPSAIYSGGIAEDPGTASLLQSATCMLPPFLVSDIYRGGEDAGITVASAQQSSSCTIAPAVASDIYRGGNADASGNALLSQLPVCLIPPPQTQGIYGGGADFAANRVALTTQCPLTPLPVLDPYRGGIAGISHSLEVQQSPLCGLPPFVASDIYRGGNFSIAVSASITQIPVCALPLVVTSDIYSGGAHGNSEAMQLIVSASCALPVAVQSDIYRGGAMGTALMDSLIIACGSGNNIGPVVSDIYRGGSNNMLTQISAVQNPVCALPQFVASDIYRGGAVGEQTSVSQLQSGNCALPVVVASDIYRGGNHSEFWTDALAQTASCGLPVFVPSAIYAGGNGIGYSSVLDEISLVASVSLPNSILSICAGETVQLTAQTNGSGTLTWAINGQFATNGNPAIFSGLTDLDTISVSLASSLSCVQAGGNLSDTLVIQENAALGMNVIFASPDLLCFGSGGVPVGGAPVTGGGVLTYLWEESANLQTWQPINITDTAIFTGPITDTTWYRRIVTSSVCAGADTSNVVEVRVSPPPITLFSGTSQTGACHVAFVDGWVLFPSSSNPSELLLSIRSISNNFDPSETQVTGYLLSGNPLIDGFRVLNRSYDIVPLNNGAAKVQFYFTQADVDALSAAVGSTIQPGDLLVSRFATGQTTSGQQIQPDAVTPDFPFPGVYTIEITVPGFSSFYIHGPDPAPLPVVLKDFKAECTEEGIILRWQTASEINNHRFIIQQSSDAETWKSIGEIQGMGTSAIGKNYKWNVPRFYDESYYFRLVQEDFDGTTEVFPALSKVCDWSSTRIAAHPNPAQGSTTLYLDSKAAGSGAISLLSADGGLVWEQKLDWEAGAYSRYVDMSRLPAGMYVLVLRERNGEVQTIRILNQH